MSKVISFRLDQKNPRDEKALQILNRYIERGFTVRFAIVEAILMLEAQNDYSDSYKIIELETAINRLNLLIGKLECQPALTNNDIDKPIISHSNLTEGFVESIKKSLKPALFA